MSFLDRFFGKPPVPLVDPTTDWPELAIPDLVVAPDAGQINELSMGDPVEKAVAFGRPSKFAWREHDYCSLIYSHPGLQLDFEKNRLAYIALFLDRHSVEPDLAEGFVPAEVTLKSESSGTILLSRTAHRSDIEKLYGRPGESDADDDEIALTYSLRGLTMEFELHPKTECLRRWNLYPTEKD